LNSGVIIIDYLFPSLVNSYVSGLNTYASRLSQLTRTYILLAKMTNQEKLMLFRKDTLLYKYSFRFSRLHAQSLGKVSGRSRSYTQTLGKVSGRSRWFAQTLGKVPECSRLLTQTLGKVSGCFRWVFILLENQNRLAERLP